MLKVKVKVKCVKFIYKFYGNRKNQRPSLDLFHGRILHNSKKQNKYYLSKFRLKMKTIDEKNRISAICDSTYFLIIQSNF